MTRKDAKTAVAETVESALKSLHAIRHRLEALEARHEDDWPCHGTALYVACLLREIDDLTREAWGDDHVRRADGRVVKCTVPTERRSP